MAAGEREIRTGAARLARRDLTFAAGAGALAVLVLGGVTALRNRRHRETP
ncbi:hypothetical protein OG936_07230 [Streptomyces sp. NBC_00846]|nr:hypothetical protein OG936_07230 [Streptomyces sp. NBC_00846]